MNTDLEPSAKSRINCLGELGRGETTIVELIYDEARQATFARKRWPRTSAETRFRLKQQFRRAQAIQHRNLVRLYELDATGNETSLIMEVVTGSDVVAHMQALAQAGCDDAHYIAVAVDVLRQLTEALVALHAGGLVHRDVKPRNVLVEPSGRVVLLDAGFAWPPQQHFDPQRDRVLAATLPYVAPECLRGALPSEEADWYSFGALAAELLAGRTPFSGSLDVVLRAKDAPFHTLREPSPAVPELLDELVCALLIRDPSARPTAIEVQEVLAELAADYPMPQTLAADGGGEPASPDESGMVETFSADTDAPALPSIAAPAVSMVVGPSAASMTLEVELARTADAEVFEIEPEPQVDDAVDEHPASEPEPSADDEPLQLTAATDEIDPTPEPFEPEPARVWTPDESSVTRLEPHSHHNANDAAFDAEAELFALETLTAFDRAHNPPAPVESVPDALGLDLAAELRDALVTRRVFDTPEAIEHATPLPGLAAPSAELEPKASEIPQPLPSLDDVLSAADPAVLETFDRVFDAAEQVTSDIPFGALLASPLPANDAVAAPVARAVVPLPAAPLAADGGRDHQEPRAVADPWLQRALDPEFTRNAPSSITHEPWIDLAFEQARAGALPSVSRHQSLEIQEDPTGRFAVTDAWIELALDPTEPLARVDTTSLREPWNTLTLEPLDELPPLTTDSADPEQRRDSWRALEPHELPEALRDPDFPALPLYDEDDDPALELAEPRPRAIGLLGALQLTAANDELPPLEQTSAQAPHLAEERAVREAPAIEPASPPANDTTRRSPTADLRVERLEQQLRASDAQLILIRGDASSGKTELLEELLQRVESSACSRTVLTCSVASDNGTAFAPLHTLLAQVLPIAERCKFTLPVDRASALQAIFPQLRPHLPQAPHTSALALEPQRRWIDAVLGFRAFFRQLTAEQPLLIAIDDAHQLDLDSAHLLRALLAVAPTPNITWLLTQRADAELPPPLMAAIAPSHRQARVPVAMHDMDPLRSSRLSLPPINADDATEREDATTLIIAADAASDALALHRSAELHTRALRAASTPALEQLEAAAAAFSRAGRLREASEAWLSAARHTRDPLQAQRFELNAGAAQLRAGDENRGRELLQGVLKLCDLAWPRAPLLTSTLERARLLLQSHRPRIPVHDAELRRRRFDALWHSAKAMLLCAPVTGDALSVRALREALMLGDASRLAWALGYEAVSAANIGGSFMRRRASTLVSEMRALAQQSGTAFDAAYARSVEAAVAFLSGDWYDAEQLLRTALHGFARAPEPTAHEEHVVGTFLVSALEAQGKLEALTELLPDLQLMAAETGHCTAHALYALAEAGLPALAGDRALEAIASADAVLAELGTEGFSPLHFQHFVATASARLYAGHYAQAFQQVEQTWQRVRHTYLPQLDAVSVMLLQLRARAALALAKQSSVHEGERLVKHATKITHELADSSLPHALALRHVLDANLSLLRGRTADADAHCWQASQCFEGAGMTLMSEVARHARSALAETAEAQADAARCRAYFARIGIARPSAFTGAWFPVFGN